jgi:uncharacterized membrane protein YphA (DoxX/SURF4 family)
MATGNKERIQNRPANFGMTLGIAIVLTLFRVWAGYLWLTQLSWKAPWLNAGFGCDSYRFNPPAGQELHGLCDWMQREVTYPTIGLYGDFVKNIVIANFDLFAWLTILTETFIAVSLILGLLTRLGGLVGTAWGLSLLIGLSGVPGEHWYDFLFYIIPPLVFAIIGARNQFSVDALLAKRYESWAAAKNPVGRLLKLVSGARPGSAGVI